MMSNSVSQPLSTTCNRRRTSKRPYKKSTNGCKDCKARKIKCDEKRPVCGNCTRHYIGVSRCEYGSGEEKSNSSPEFSIPSNPRHTPLGISNSDTFQLRLIYHYTRSTCGQHIISTVPLLPASLWEVEIPQAAFSSDLVLNALLGISAIHLLSMNPEENTLALASGRYLGKALKLHQAAVKAMDSQNAEVLIIAAVLIAHHSWLSASTRSYQEPYQIDMITYRMCQGINALVAKAAPWLLEAPSNSSISIDNQTEYLLYPHFMESAQKDIDILLNCFEDGAPSQEDKDAYAQAADLLMATCSRIAHGSFGNPPIEQDILAFLQKSSVVFVKRLERNEPIAMAMMARDIALLGVLPDSSAWWIHGAGKCKVANSIVQGVCGLMPPEYLWIMDWPLKMISGEITLEI